MLSREERFWSRVHKTDGCWLWLGGGTPNGYGRFRVSDGQVGPHRFAYELLVGPIPEGLQIDHECHNIAVDQGLCAGGWACPHRRCVNPAHLVPRTRSENVGRGNTRARATHCPQGHSYDEANTQLKRDGARRCRTCHAAEEALRRDRVASKLVLDLVPPPRT